MRIYFTKDSDYKTKFKNEVTRLVSEDSDNAAEKVRLTDELTEAYISGTGERPDSRELDELSSWLIFGKKGLTVRKKMEVKAFEEAKLRGVC